MNSFKSYLLFLFTLILTATLFFSCSDSDNKGMSFPKEFQGTWVWEKSSDPPIDFGEDGEKINALIIDIGKNIFEVRGYRYTDHELAARMKLVDLDDDTFFLEQTDFVNNEGKWQKESDITKVDIDFELDIAKTEITLMPGEANSIPMKKTTFKKPGDLIGTWENMEKQMTMKFGDKNFTYTVDTYVYSGTWDASGDNEGIIRTIMTKAEGVSGLSVGGASPYVLNGDILSIWYPNDENDPNGTTEVAFTKKTP